MRVFENRAIPSGGQNENFNIFVIFCSFNIHISTKSLLN